MRKSLLDSGMKFNGVREASGTVLFASSPSVDEGLGPVATTPLAPRRLAFP